MFKIETLLILSLAICATAVRVPVDNKEEIQTTQDTPTENEPDNNDKSVVYTHNADNVDSYLIPPDPQAPDEEYAALEGEPGTPATYLLPPLPDAPVDYLAPQPSPLQTDWYPIVQGPFKPIKYKIKPKALPIPYIPILPLVPEGTEAPSQSEDVNVEDAVSINFPLPSSELQPPKDEPADYPATAPSTELELPRIESKRDFQIPSLELQLPLLESTPNFNSQLVKEVPLNFHSNPVHPTLALHLTPPRPPVLYKYKNPTKLYPKKYVGGFNPIPIPLLTYGDKFRDVPKVKLVEPYNAVTNQEGFLLTPEDKKLYQLEKAEQKRKLKDEEDSRIQQEILESSAEENDQPTPASEPVASETGYRVPGRNRYPLRLVRPRPAPLRAAPQPSVGADRAAEKEYLAPPPGDRTEFRMHGMNGPHSYQFGYDTGKGKNRQFRYEERDNEGRVRGHYGYVDKLGKLRVVKYDADPERGFHSDAVPDPADHSDAVPDPADHPAPAQHDLP